MFFVDTDHREVEEHFVVTITGVSGNASIDSLTSNVTVIILKHGMPNGLFGFESVSTKTVSESKGSPVILTVQRREGREGTVEVMGTRKLAPTFQIMIKMLLNGIIVLSNCEMLNLFGDTQIFSIVIRRVVFFVSEFLFCVHNK